VQLLRQIPSIGLIRAALLVALLQTPHRFRTKRQLWAYSGFAVETHDSGEYRYVRGKLQRNRERITVRGLNDNHNKDVKNLFKSATISASTRPGPLHDFYVARVEKGMRPTMARRRIGRVHRKGNKRTWIVMRDQSVVGHSTRRVGHFQLFRVDAFFWIQIHSEFSQISGSRIRVLHPTISRY